MKTKFTSSVNIFITMYQMEAKYQKNKYVTFRELFI